MVDLNYIQSKNQEDIDAVASWCDEIYSATFADFFEEQRILFKRLKSTKDPILDAELELILIDIPLRLFEVAEVLNRFRVSKEVLIMNNKRLKSEYTKMSAASTETKRKEAAALDVLEDELLVTAYTSVITRVEAEISFSRELIMGAKKLWDGRRSAERPAVGEINSTEPDLPEYTPNSPLKSYVHG